MPPVPDANIIIKKTKKRLSARGAIREGVGGTDGDEEEADERASGRAVVERTGAKNLWRSGQLARM